MNYTTIQKALDTQLSIVAGIPTFTEENARFKPSATTPFTRSTLLPAQTVVESIGVHGIDRVNGLYQVDLYYPADQGYTTANTMADLVIAAFPKALQLTTTDSIKVDVDVTWRLPARKVQNFYNVPVIVSWKSYISS